MLIIDINKHTVHQSNTGDHDVVVLKGASPGMTAGLRNLVEQRPPTYGQFRYGARANKYPIRERLQRTVPASIRNAGSGSFDEVFQQLSRTLNQITEAPQVSATFQGTVNRRINLQNRLASTLIANSNFVEAVRVRVQISNNLNPNRHTVTTRNIQTAIALYAHYSEDHGFSASLGSARIVAQINVSTDSISRLATDLRILRKAGRSTATRYFVSHQFGTELLSVLTSRSGPFGTLSGTADVIQDQIDALGSVA